MKNGWLKAEKYGLHQNLVLRLANVQWVPHARVLVRAALCCTMPCMLCGMLGGACSLPVLPAR